MRGEAEAARLELQQLQEAHKALHEQMTTSLQEVSLPPSIWHTPLLETCVFHLCKRQHWISRIMVTSLIELFPCQRLIDGSRGGLSRGVCGFRIYRVHS